MYFKYSLLSTWSSCSCHTALPLPSLHLISRFISFPFMLIQSALISYRHQCLHWLLRGIYLAAAPSRLHHHISSVNNKQLSSSSPDLSLLIEMNYNSCGPRATWAEPQWVGHTENTYVGARRLSWWLETFCIFGNLQIKKQFCKKKCSLYIHYFTQPQETIFPEIWPI